MSGSGHGARLGALCLAGLILAGCATPTPPLYLWETFPRQQYEALLGDKSTPAEQILAMEAHAEKARAAHAALPPGFRAHLGLLKLDAGDGDAARHYWTDERAVFPESAPYMDSLLSKLDPASITKK